MTCAGSLHVDTGFDKQNFDVGLTEFKFVTVGLF